MMIHRVMDLFGYFRLESIICCTEVVSNCADRPFSSTPQTLQEVPWQEFSFFFYGVSWRRRGLGRALWPSELEFLAVIKTHQLSLQVSNGRIPTQFGLFVT